MKTLSTEKSKSTKVTGTPKNLVIEIGEPNEYGLCKGIVLDQAESLRTMFEITDGEYSIVSNCYPAFNDNSLFIRGNQSGLDNHFFLIEKSHVPRITKLVNYINLLPYNCFETIPYTLNNDSKDTAFESTESINIDISNDPIYLSLK